MEIILAPIRDPNEEWERIERKIIELFRKNIYIPLLGEIAESSAILKNARAASLVDAIGSGRVTFNRGVFSGRFNSKISQQLDDLGAKWDRKSSTWKLHEKKLPAEIKIAINQSEFRFKQKLENIDRFLSQISPQEIASKLKISDLFDSALFRTDKRFFENVKNITVVPKLTPERAKRISEEWQNNMDLWIQNWTKETIVKLREQMQESVFAGNRYEAAVSTIQKSYGVSRNKAKFLARQETKLLVTTFKEIRYQEAGIDEYKWKCVTGTSLHPVRPMHKQLNDRSAKGEIFKFSNPPIDDSNGGRHNPGQNYNCRCVALAVVRFSKK